MDKIIKLSVIKGYKDLCLDKYIEKLDEVILYNDKEYIDIVNNIKYTGYDRAKILIKTRRLKLKSIEKIHKRK